jgi:hypothetical protein
VTSSPKKTIAEKGGVGGGAGIIVGGMSSTPLTAIIGISAAELGLLLPPTWAAEVCITKHCTESTSPALRVSWHSFSCEKYCPKGDLIYTGDTKK